MMRRSLSFGEGLLLVAPTVLLGLMGYLWKPILATKDANEKTYQYVGAKRAAKGNDYVLVVFQRSRDVHTLAASAKEVVSRVMASCRIVHKAAPTSLLIKFYYSREDFSDETRSIEFS